MDSPPPHPEQLEDLSLRYALSLSIGMSLDLGGNCGAFLNTLLQWTHFDAAAVWLADHALPAAAGQGGYTLVGAQPPDVTPEAHLPASHPLVARAAGGICSAAAVEDLDAGLMGDPGGQEGIFVLFPLGGIGLLQLYSRQRRQPFPVHTLQQMEGIMAKFTMSLQACLSHERLVFEMRERRRVEEVLRRRDRAMGATNSGMIIVDALAPDMPVIYCNPAFERITGYAREEILGRNCRVLQGPETDPAAVAVIREALREERECEVILRNYRRDGRPFWNELKIAPVWNEQGRVTHFVGVQTDVTSRITAEQELVQARQVAEASVKARERFLANMSHEMRTPLNAIIGLAHLLGETGPTPPQAHYLRTIQFSAEHLLALINDILDLAKIESGRIEFEAVPFRLADLLNNLIETVRPQAEQKGLQLALRLGAAPACEVVGDPLRLNQILLNLIGNAIKFTEEGGVTVSAEVVDASASHRVIRFSIADTGIGIPEEKLPTIFDSFTQAERSTPREYGGTGLGLAIVKELVERQDGRVEVESTEGRGSVFSFELPFRLAHPDILPEEPAAEADGAAAALDGAHILLVEDNEINQLITRQMLERWGAVVDVAGNGRLALERLRQQRYDLVLMDLRMPEMDGFEAVRRIRRRPGHSAEELPILALTASAPAEHLTETEAAGLNGFLLKPFKPDELRHQIAAFLGRRPAPASEHAAGRAASPADAPLVDLTLLEQSALGEERFILKMMDLFREQAPRQLEGMHKALAEEDWPQIHSLAHKMKASAGLFGIEALKETLAAAETLAARSADRDELAALLDTAENLCRRALEELETLRSHYGRHREPSHPEVHGG